MFKASWTKNHSPIFTCSIYGLSTLKLISSSAFYHLFISASAFNLSKLLSPVLKGLFVQRDFCFNFLYFFFKSIISCTSNDIFLLWIGNCSVSNTQEKKSLQFRVLTLRVPWLHQPKKASFVDEAFNGPLPEIIKHQQQYHLISLQNQF